MSDKKNLHVKPTPEELADKDEQLQSELDDMAAAESKKAEEVKTEAKEIAASVDEAEDKEPELETKEAEEPKEEVVEDKEEVKPVEDDAKKKFAKSAQEAQVLHSRIKSFKKASEVPDPTEDDLKKEYPEWDELDEFQKKIAKNDLKNTWRNQAIDAVVKESEDVDKWNVKVDEFIDDPANLTKYPDLEGKLPDFKLFTQKPSRTNIDFDDLVKAFLFDVQTNKPAKNKGKMFETGSGGPSDKTKPKSDKISVEQGAILKQTDYNEYKRLLMAGKIAEEV